MFWEYFLFTTPGTTNNYTNFANLTTQLPQQEVNDLWHIWSIYLSALLSHRIRSWSPPESRSWVDPFWASDWLREITWLLGADREGIPKCLTFDSNSTSDESDVLKSTTILFSFYVFSPVTLYRQYINESDEIKMHPLVVIHGMFGSSKNWMSMSKALSKRMGREVRYQATYEFKDGGIYLFSGLWPQIFQNGKFGHSKKFIY